MPQLVDISKLGLNSKTRNSAILSFAERVILPPRGRIAFCLQSEACICRLSSSAKALALLPLELKIAHTHESIDMRKKA